MAVLHLSFDFGGLDFVQELFGRPDVDEDFEFFFVLDELYTGNASLAASTFLRNCFLDAGTSLGRCGAEGTVGL